MDNEQTEARYRNAEREFNEVYKPLKKRYNLRMHSCFSIYADGLIEAWEYDGDTRGKCILKVTEEDSIECYKRATEYLKDYKRKKERVEYGSGVNMAV